MSEYMCGSLREEYTIEDARKDGYKKGSIDSLKKLINYLEAFERDYFSMRMLKEITEDMIQDV